MSVLPDELPDGPMLDEVRELAAAWALRLDEIAGAMFAYLAERLPEATADPDIAGLTLASCTSNVEALVSMLRHGIPLSATEAPVAALEHARRMAARGVSVDTTLRFYRLGHASFWGVWSAALTEAIPDRERLVVALRQTAAFTFGYIDIVSARVGAEHVAERERRQRRAAIVRADVVRAVLAGDAVDVGQAERALGHALAGEHLAFVCWSARDPAELERVAGAVAAELGGGRALLVPDGPLVLGGWVHPDGAARRDASPPAGRSGPLEATPQAASSVADVGSGSIAGVPLARLADIARTASEDVHVALGSPGAGLAGFRETRLQADRARRVAELTAVRAPSLTAYADVALVDLLSRDLDAARSFVMAELGGLAAAGDVEARARETVLSVVAPQGGLAAAARALGVHRNTVLQRVRRAEELRGHPATHRPAELHAALLLASVLGGSVLGR